MKSIQIYVQDACPYCDEINIPVGVNAEKIYINRDDFKGFIPGSVPVIQFNGVTLEGPHAINAILTLIEKADDYKE